MRLIPIIGLEIHVRLKTKSKMFCGCANVDDSEAPNTSICHVCTGQPGALPAVNMEALRLGVRAGLALGCRIPDEAHFDRKNYFYPDLPKGYQISQFDHPICIEGHFDVEVPGNVPPRDRIRVGITRAHLEEDAAKNIHDGATNATLVDFNRAGQPLLEIVTEPDIRTPSEARAFLQELQAVLRAVGASDADMEKGFMRCDANISLLEVGEDNKPLKAGLNPKIEIKNLNSFRSVERALTYEIERQLEVYNSGGLPEGATRGFDENKNVTFEQRLKETFADYRYFPEPDLRPLDLIAIREEEKVRLPELPAMRRVRIVEEWGFAPEDARVLVATEGWADFAEATLSEVGGWLESTDKRNDVSGGELLAAHKTKYAKLVSGWLASKLAGILAAQGKTIAHANITQENFAEFLHMIETGKINSANAMKLLQFMVDTGADPSQIMEEHNLGQMNDPAALTKLVSELIAQNPDQVAQIKAGKVALVKWFVGVIMKSTEGRTNPEAAEQEIKKQIGV
ncbi:Asp-tRNA(Asn)/Glu-tRNA(Gln) amidotransferase subunit GatB [Candidatus Uhrbacteria bacterium]|nr:Asp-tRNA(Asn)/Glu-tRNA(Gln) amidotransferase subunit GatB [Candidatus Uhrbacteria bacterium]